MNTKLQFDSEVNPQGQFLGQFRVQFWEKGSELRIFKGKLANV